MSKLSPETQWALVIGGLVIAAIAVNDAVDNLTTDSNGDGVGSTVGDGVSHGIFDGLIILAIGVAAAL